MIKLQKALLACLLILLGMAGMAGSASADVTLTVGSNWVWSGNTVQVPITVDNPATLAGAAFTITYSANLTLDSVDSIFFDTFANQWASLSPAPDPLPPSSVEVDSVVYDQPLITNTITEGMRIAAARCMPAAAGGETTIFTLTFSLKAEAAPGKYTVDIIATELDNEAAGYDAGGETIPMLVGADLSVSDPTAAGAFPVLAPATADPDAGSVTFEIDEDDDGVGDFWEIDHFGSIQAKDGTEDSDNDGYSDAQEFENNTDPGEQDAAGGEGYNEITDNRVPKQHVYVTPASPIAAPETDFTIEVYYDAESAGLGGLELRIFYNSSVISWKGISDQINTPSVSGATSDGSNLDDDASTDQYVTVDYSSETNWPGAVPINLFSAGFTVADVADDTTSNINITAVSAESGYFFYSDPVVFEVKSYTLGDVNDDGKINYIDALMIFQQSAGIITMSSTQSLAANTYYLNGDVKINYLDALRVFQYAAGIITEF